MQYYIHMKVNLEEWDKCVNLTKREIIRCNFVLFSIVGSHVFNYWLQLLHVYHIFCEWLKPLSHCYNIPLSAGFTDETPHDYQCNLGPDGRRRDAYERPELCKGTVEFVASKEYMVRLLATYFCLGWDLIWTWLKDLVTSYTLGLNGTGHPWQRNCFFVWSWRTWFWGSNSDLDSIHLNLHPVKQGQGWCVKCRSVWFSSIIAKYQLEGQFGWRRFAGVFP